MWHVSRSEGVSQLGLYEPISWVVVLPPPARMMIGMVPDGLGCFLSREIRGLDAPLTC
jgi:hypothetical protein